jgi:hypothetical protein
VVYPPKAEVRGSNPFGRHKYQANPSKSEKNCIIRCFDLPQWYQAVGSFMRISMGIIKNQHGVYFRCSALDRVVDLVKRGWNGSADTSVALGSGARIECFIHFGTGLKTRYVLPV